MTRLMHSSQHLQHPKKHKKLPEPTAETGKQVIQIASEWNKIQGQHREKSRWSVETSEEDIQNKKLIAAPCDAI